MPKSKNALNSLILVLLVVVLGTAGFMVIEGWPLLDALYMTIITVSTIGYGETHSLSDTGRIFDILLIVVSISVVAYGVTNLVGFIVEGKLNSYFKVKRMEKALLGLKDHYIICGAGRTGHAIIEEFQGAKVPFVVIEKSEEVVEQLKEKHVLAICGDSASDEILNLAGISRAKRIIVVHSTDSENLFAVLSCRQLNPDIYIVARALDKVNEPKLMKCGANVTLSTSEIGGHRLASIALNPSINSFLDVVQRTNKMDASIVEFIVTPSCSLKGKNQKEANIRGSVGVTILGILRNKEYIFNPGPEIPLEAEDTLLLFGTNEQIKKFKQVYGTAM
ncbi:MAG: potassium channel protein [Clostridia bacterium]|nr:potassium channel protein [Clostridia bacterium]